MLSVGIALFLFFFVPILFDDYCGAEIYKYQDENGNWCFTDSPVNLPDNVKLLKVENGETNQKIIDLTKQLSEKFPASNKIEQATRATVAIKTSVGYGSGFFITEDGYILTNKHVVEAGKMVIKESGHRLDEDKTTLKEFKRWLDKEKVWLKQQETWFSEAQAAMKKLEKTIRSAKNRTYFNRLVSEYNAWEAKYSIRWADYKRRYVDYNDLLSKYETKKRGHDEARKAFIDLRLKTSYQRGFKVLLMDKTELSAEIVKISDHHDLALLKVDGYKVPFIEPANVNQLVQGKPLFAIGTPLGFMNSVTRGIFSGRRMLGNKTYIQTDAEINQGNSGGPLITKNGKVVGINTWKIVGPGIEGLNFAIPIDVALEEFRHSVRGC